jgi:hypothetical protein
MIGALRNSINAWRFYKYRKEIGRDCKMFSINGVQFKNPSTFKIERFNVTNLERLADGTMAGEQIAKKLKFYFTYEALTGAQLDAILALIWDGDLFFTLSYPYNGSSRTAVVYVGSIPTDVYRGGDTPNWVWTNVQFNLIEK